MESTPIEEKVTEDLSQMVLQEKPVLSSEAKLLKANIYVKLKPMSVEKEGGMSGEKSEKQVESWDEEKAIVSVSGVMGGRKTNKYTFPTSVIGPDTP